MSEQELTTFFLQIGVLTLFARLSGECTRRLGLPVVVGEILAGICLGPTLLRELVPGWQASLFPLDTHNPIALGAITSLGSILFLLTAGMEVDLAMVRQQGCTAVLVSLAGILVPFTFAFAPALLWPGLFGQHPNSHPIVFALFLGVALAITALSVTSKILIDLGLFRTPFGMLVISAAVFDDLVGWILAAVILALDNLHDAHSLGARNIFVMVVATLLYTTVMLTLGRWGCNRLLPLLYRWCGNPGRVIGFTLGTALLGAAFTQAIGMHGLFGAFMVGIAVGTSPQLQPETRESIVQVVSHFLAPLFFASVGLSVDFVAHFDVQTVVAVLLLACFGKVLGCTTASRWAGMPWRQALAVGFAMNARGGMEILLGFIALREEIIDERMFVALAIMTVVTCSFSGLVVRRLLPRKDDRPPRASNASEV